MPIIATTSLSRSYGRRVGIDGLDLEVPEGSIFGFLGPNGAGKTTTIRILLGFLRADSGSATIFSKNCWRESPAIKRDVGYLPGDLRLYPWMTASSALSIMGRMRGADLRAHGSALASEFELDTDVPVRKMSLGMRQKLGLILAMAHQPRLLILDEPTSGLDPINQEVLADHLRMVARDGCTVFFSSHTLSTVEKLCDRVAIVRRGRIVASETLQALRQRALRRVEIGFASDGPAPEHAPSFLRVRARRGSTWLAALTGDVNDLIAWLEPIHVRSLSISPPDLESLFHSFYFDDAADGDEPA